MKTKRLLCLTIGIVLLASLLCSCKAPVREKLEQIRTNTNNMQNNRMATSDGEWLYYINGLDFCKWKPGENETIIAELSQNFYGILQYVDRKLYYADGTYPRVWNDETESFEIIPLEVWIDATCFQTDGKYYYTDCAWWAADPYGDTGVFRIDVTNPDEGEKILNEIPSEIYLHGEYIYVMFDFIFDEDDNTSYRGTWRLDLDGGNPIQVLESCPEYFVVTEDRIYYSEDKVYYHEDGWSYYAEDWLHSMNLDGSEQYTYEDVMLGDGLNVTDSYIFYIDYDTGRIHRMTLDGTENIELNQSDSGPINLLDDWLIYRNYDDGKLYAMDYHGLNSYCISN